MINPILGFNGEFRPLSNFWESEVILHGVTYKYVECAYQAAKCVNPLDRIQFKNCNPFEAKKLGYKVAIKPHWNDIKLPIMENLVRQKWLHLPLLKVLLSTGNRYIEESNYWHDQDWGNCTCEKHKDIPGQNHLGKLHMKIREELQNFGMCVF